MSSLTTSNFTLQFPNMGRDLQSVRQKFNKLQASRIPTGDPTCPPAVRRAKRIHRDIEEKMDAEEEMEEKELGFPNNNENEMTMMTMTNPNPSTPLFRQPKRARLPQPEPVSSKMEGILSVLVTKMVADQSKTEELQEERKEMMRFERKERE